MGYANCENSITVIVPFYKGNAYVKKLIENVINVRKKSNVDITEIIFVNDSPWEEIDLPVLDESFPIMVTALKNDQNCGIQKSRVKGIRACSTPLAIFLDQDDELIAEGFEEQMKLIRAADVVVGNGLYQYGDIFKPIYKNKKVMNYLIQKKRFVEIRNLIPSPGCCLLRKNAIPQEWLKTCLTVNGADDWYLWLLMFSEGKRFSVNSGMVYQHNSTEFGNLSADLDKMHQSALEMYMRLKENGVFSNDELRLLRKAIDFKYFQDKNGLNIDLILRYAKTFVTNVKYKLRLYMC